MKKVLIAAIAIAVGSAPVSAEEQATNPAIQAAVAVSAPSSEQLDLARQFIAMAASRDAVMATTRTLLLQSASYGIEDEGERAIAKAKLDGLFVRLAPYIDEALPGLLETYAQVYAREFSPDDLRDLIAFARSPGGKHYLLKEHLLDADPEVAKAQLALWTRLTPVMENYAREQCGKRAAERVAAGDTKAKCPMAAGGKAASARG